MRLSATGLRNGARIEVDRSSPCRAVRRRVPARDPSKRSVCWTCFVAGWGREDRMRMRRDFSDRQCYCCFPAGLTYFAQGKPSPLPLVNRHAALEIRQGKS